MGVKLKELFLLKGELADYITPALYMVGMGLLQIMLNVSDTAVVGHFSTLELAGLGAAHATYILFYTFFVGFSSGLDFIFGKSSKSESTSHNFQNIFSSTTFAIAFGVFSMAGTFLLADYFYIFGSASDVVRSAQRYLEAVAYSLPFTMVFYQLQKFNQALGNQRPFLFLAIWINILNVVLNIVLVFGWQGIVPSFGSAGAGWCTFLCRLIMVAIALSWTREMLVSRALSRRESPSLSLPSFESYYLKIRQMLALGIPGGFQYLGVVVAASLVSLLASGYGQYGGSANQTVYQFQGVAYMIPASISALVSMKTSQLFGENSIRGAIRKARVGVGLTIVSSLVCVLPLAIFPATLVSALTNDPFVIDEATRALRLTAVFQLGYAVMLAMNGAMIGIGEAKKPMYASLIGSYCVGVPVAILYTEFVQEGVFELWLGLTVGMITTATLSTHYWVTCSRALQSKFLYAGVSDNRPLEGYSSAEWVSWSEVKEQLVHSRCQISKEA